MTASFIRTQRRHFFNVPNILSSKKQYSERKLLNFSQNQLYNVVSNVEEYYQFIPFCTHSRVFSNTSLPNGQSVMKAELGVGFKLFAEKYMSKVTCHQPHLVKAVAADAKLFNDMTTTWKFTPNVPKTTINSPEAADHPTCYVDFDISFDFASPIHAQASSVFFDQTKNKITEFYTKPTFAGPTEKQRKKGSISILQSSFVIDVNRLARQKPTSAPKHIILR